MSLAQAKVDSLAGADFTFNSYFCTNNGAGFPTWNAGAAFPISQLKIQVPRLMVNRKFYFYFEPSSYTSVMWNCEIGFFLDGQRVLMLPEKVNTLPNTDPKYEGGNLQTMRTGQGASSNMTSSISINPTDAFLFYFNGNGSATVWPKLIKLECDEIRLDFIDSKNGNATVVNAKIMLACLSMNLL